MDKVYTLTMKVRYEGETLMGIYKSLESAEDAAETYMEDSVFEWMPLRFEELPFIWHSDMDADLVLCDEEVQP